MRMTETIYFYGRTHGGHERSREEYFIAIETEDVAYERHKKKL